MTPTPSGWVIVVGSLNMDLVVRVHRLPAPGETVTGGTLHRALGGKGANQAAAAAKLGAHTALVGLTGDDEFGRIARRDLADHGVDQTGLGRGEHPTGVATILVDASGENLIAVAPGANDEVSGSYVTAHLQRLCQPGAVVLSVLELRDEAVAAAAATAGDRGCRFVLNPAPARPLPAELLERCDVLTPNEHELRTLGGVEALHELGVGAVVVTRGAQGAELHVPGRSPVHFDAFPADVVDTTGAGDAFNGALAWAMAEGRPLEDAVRCAAAAGALATRALGARAGLPDRTELERMVRIP